MTKNLGRALPPPYLDKIQKKKQELLFVNGEPSLIDSYQFDNTLTTTEFSWFKIVWSQFGLHECKFIFNLGWTIKNADKTSRDQKVLP